MTGKIKPPNLLKRELQAKELAAACVTPYKYIVQECDATAVDKIYLAR